MLYYLRFDIIGLIGAILRDMDVKNLGGYNFYITHGYEQRVKSGPDYLLKDAKENGRDVALFGHTHRQFYEERLGVHLFNPGALNYGDYGIITIDESTGAITFEHKEL